MISGGKYMFSINRIETAVILFMYKIKSPLISSSEKIENAKKIDKVLYRARRRCKFKFSLIKMIYTSLSTAILSKNVHFAFFQIISMRAKL